MKSYKELDIYRRSLDLFYKVHPLSLSLPKYECFELGSQVRRSADSVVTNIVEGYGRKRYPADFIKFLTYSHASALETQCHLEKLQHLYPKSGVQWEELRKEYDRVGAMLYRFIQYVEKNWNHPIS